MDRIEERSTGRVQECLDAAAHCEKRAASATDRTVKATFAEAARCWRELARCWRECLKCSCTSERPALSCRPVEKSNNEDSVNFFVAHREWLTDTVLKLAAMALAIRRFGGPRAKVRR
jgi:hypothetical protein